MREVDMQELRRRKKIVRQLEWEGQRNKGKRKRKVRRREKEQQMVESRPKKEIKYKEINGQKER